MLTVLTKCSVKTTQDVLVKLACLEWRVFFQKHNWTFKYIINFGKSLDIRLAIWLPEVAPEEIIYNVRYTEQIFLG